MRIRLPQRQGHERGFRTFPFPGDEAEVPLHFLRALPARISEQARQTVGDGPFPVLEYSVMNFMPGRDLTERFLFPEHFEHNFCLEFRSDYCTVKEPPVSKSRATCVLK